MFNPGMIHRRSLLAGLALALGFATALPAQSSLSEEEAALLQAGLSVTADSFILPSYRRWEEATEGLATSLESYCAGSGGIDAVEAAFRDSFLAWQRASIIQTGPAMDLEASLRVQLWPDKKGFSRRAVRAAVASEDPALLSPGGLERQSIALPNLTALESLIDAAPDPGSYACDLAAAIARYQFGLAETITAAWTEGAGFRSDFDSAATGNARYGSVDDLIRELLAGMIVHSDRLRKFKIQRGLGTEPGATWPDRTEAVRSGLGLASIETGFRALAELYDVPYGFFDVTPDIGGSMEYYVLSQTAGNIADSIAILPGSLVEIAEEDGAAAAELRGYGERVLDQEDYLKTGLPQSIGLISGFTSADGD